MLNNKWELTNWAQNTKHKNTNWHQNLSQKSSKNPIFVVRKWAPQEVVLFLTLEVVPKLTLERLKSGTKTNSPAYIYMCIYIYIYIQNIFVPLAAICDNFREFFGLEYKALQLLSWHFATTSARLLLIRGLMFKAKQILSLHSFSLGQGGSFPSIWFTEPGISGLPNIWKAYLGDDFGKGMRQSTFHWKQKVFQWKGGRQFSEWGVWYGFLQPRQFSEEVPAIHWTAGLWKLKSCCRLQSSSPSRKSAPTTFSAKWMGSAIT